MERRRQGQASRTDDLGEAADANSTSVRRTESAICVVCQPWLPHRVSRAVTTAACCFRRWSSAMTACRDPDWPSSGARPVRAVLPRQLTGRGRRAARLSTKRSRPEPAVPASPARAEPRRRALSQAQASSQELSLSQELVRLRHGSQEPGLSPELSLAQAQIRGAEPAHPGAGAAMPARLSGALPRAAPAPRPQHAPCRAGPRRPPARAATAPRRQAARHGRAPSPAMRRPRAPGRVRVRVRRMQARNNSGHYPLLPAGRKAAAEHGRPVTALLPNALPSTRKLTE